MQITRIEAYDMDTGGARSVCSALVALGYRAVAYLRSAPGYPEDQATRIVTTAPPDVAQEVCAARGYGGPVDRGPAHRELGISYPRIATRAADTYEAEDLAA